MLSLDELSSVQAGMYSGDRDRQVESARRVSTLCASGAQQAHQLCGLVQQALLDRDTVLVNARAQLLSAVMRCHLAGALNFGQMQDLLFKLVDLELDRHPAEQNELFLCLLLQHCAHFAGALDRAVFAALADKHPSVRVRVAARAALSSASPSLVHRWEATLGDAVTPADRRASMLEEALGASLSTESSVRAVFNYSRGHRIDRSEDALLKCLVSIQQKGGVMVQLAAALAVMATAQPSVPEWTMALMHVCRAAFDAQAPHGMADAVLILQYISAGMPEVSSDIERAVADANLQFVRRFDPGVSRTLGNGVYP